MSPRTLKYLHAALVGFVTAALTYIGTYLPTGLAVKSLLVGACVAGGSKAIGMLVSTIQAGNP